MSSIYQAQVLEGGPDGNTVTASTSIYADSELEARMSAATQLGVPPERVTITLVPGVSNPSDAELRAMWDDLRSRQIVNTETTGGGAYG